MNAHVTTDGKHLRCVIFSHAKVEISVRMETKAGAQAKTPARVPLVSLVQTAINLTAPHSMIVTMELVLAQIIARAMLVTLEQCAMM